MISRKGRRRRWVEHQTMGWVAYGLREGVIEGMVPDLMQVESTSVCNLRCVFCPYDRLSRPKRHLDPQAFAQLLNQASAVRSVGLHHFGEPFLNPRLPECVTACTRLGIDTTVATNATRISQSQVEEVIAAGLTRLIVSLDAVSAADYERLRLGGSFDQVLETIDRFLATKCRLGGGPYVQMQFIATPENRTTWPVFERTWRGRPGVDQVVLRDERTHAGQRVRHGEYRLRGGDRLPCRYLWESLVVLVDGRVVPCCKDFDGTEILGNVFAGDRLADLWNGPRMLQLRRTHLAGNYDQLPLCASCREWPGHAPLDPQRSRQAFAAFRRTKDTSRAQPVYRRDFE